MSKKRIVKGKVEAEDETDLLGEGTLPATEIDTTEVLIPPASESPTETKELEIQKGHGSSAVGTAKVLLGYHPVTGAEVYQ